MQSHSMSGQSKGMEEHVDLDQKNPDSVYYDEGFMPDLQRKRSGQRKDKFGSSRANQSKSNRRKVMEKKRRFIEICRDGKMSDKKSTLSREDRRVKRQLFIMQNHNKKSVTVPRKQKVKETKKSIMFNDQYDLQGKNNAKSYLQWYLKDQQESSDDALDIESISSSPKNLDLSDHEDIRKCCLDYLDTKKDKRARARKKKKDLSPLQVETLGEQEGINGKIKGQDSRDNGRNGVDNGKVGFDAKVQLTKREFKDAFKKELEEMKKLENRGLGEGVAEDSGYFGKDNDVSKSLSNEKTKDVVKKDFGNGLVCLDMTRHFLKYSIIKSVN